MTKQRFRVCPHLPETAILKAGEGKGVVVHSAVSHPVPQEEGSQVTLEEGVLTSHQGITLTLGIGNSGMEVTSKLQPQPDQTL